MELTDDQQEALDEVLYDLTDDGADPDEIESHVRIVLNGIREDRKRG